jgi:hypothetical protein
MGARQIDLDAGEASDLASLWAKAVQEYERKTKAKVSELASQRTDQIARKLSDVMDTAEEDSKKFMDWRHKKSKTSQARSLIGQHLDGISKCLSGIEMIGNAAAVFPPAMPATIVFAACSRVLGVGIGFSEYQSLTLTIY